MEMIFQRSTMLQLYFLLLPTVALACSCWNAKLSENNADLGNLTALARLQTKGVDQFLKNMIEIGSKYPQIILIPDMNTTHGALKFMTKDIHLVHFAQPKIEYTLINPHECKGSVKLPAASIQGILTVKRGLIIGSHTGSGNVTFNLTDVHANGRVVFGSFPNGFPKIKKFECKSSLGAAQLNHKGVNERFLKELLGLGTTFRPVFNLLACTVVKKIVYGKVNSFLFQIPSVFRINDAVTVQFKAQHEIFPDHIDLRLFGSVSNESVNPAQIHVEWVPDDGSMLNFFVSDDLPKSILRHLHENRIFDFVVNKDSKKFLYAFISLDGDPNLGSDCLGNVLPDLVTEYGAGATVEVKVKATKAPDIFYTTGKSVLTASIAVDFFLTKANSDPDPNPTVNAKVELEGRKEMKIVDGQLYGTMIMEKATVQVSQPNFKDWEGKIVGVLKKLVEEKMNKEIFKKGMSLHYPLGFALEMPRFTFLERTLQIQTGFVYKPFLDAQLQEDSGGSNKQNGD